MALTTTTAPRLDERLVEVAVELLDREGIEAVTLRRIAREAGVSHGAPLRHYPTLAALLSRVAARGFALLRHQIEQAAGDDTSGVPPGERLAAAGRAYVECAVAHPALFALMFRPEQLDWDVPELVEEATEAFEQLVRLVRRGQEAGWHVEADTRVLAGSVWAASHGLAMLWSQDAMQGVTGNDSLERAVAMTIEVVGGDDWKGSTG